MIRRAHGMDPFPINVDDALRESEMCAGRPRVKESVMRLDANHAQVRKVHAANGHPLLTDAHATIQQEAASLGSRGAVVANPVAPLVCGFVAAHRIGRIAERRRSPDALGCRV